MKKSKSKAKGHSESLQSLLSIRTAPFREEAIRDWATRQLSHHKIPNCTDPHGNLIIGVSSLSEYFRLLKGPHCSAPQLLFVAHMDHPGFHGLRWLPSRNSILCEFHGGGPTRHLIGAKIELKTQECGRAHEVKLTGTITNAVLNSKKTSIAQVHVKLNQPAKTLLGLSKQFQASDFFGSFRFKAPVWKTGPLWYAQAIDDLGGCYAIIQTAILASTKKNSKTPPFLALLTRGEEVGFVGALAHFKLKPFSSIKSRPVVVSLETSRTFAPGAIVGHGPVVRLGDRAGPFDAQACQVLTQVAQAKLPSRHQRRVMEGGTCEATAALANGFPAVGICIPLGNYHNQSIEGGPHSAGPGGPAPEFIHDEDLTGMILLCEAFFRSTQPSNPLHLLWSDPWQSKRQELDKILATYQHYLNRKASQAAESTRQSPAMTRGRQRTNDDIYSTFVKT